MCLQLNPVIDGKESKKYLTCSYVKVNACWETQRGGGQSPDDSTGRDHEHLGADQNKAGPG